MKPANPVKPMKPVNSYNRAPVSPSGARPSTISVRVVPVGEGLPSHEEVVAAGRTVPLGQRLRVSHAHAKPVVQRVVPDLGDRPEPEFQRPAAQPTRHRGPQLVLGLE